MGRAGWWLTVAAATTQPQRDTTRSSSSSARCVREARPFCDGGVSLACGLDSRRHTAVTLAAVPKGGVARN